MFRFAVEKLQLTPNATKINLIISSLLYHISPKAICGGIESNASPPVSDPAKRLAISFLVSSCGLSSDAALSATKVVGSKTTEKTISVIQLLKRYGFSDAHISSIAIKRAQLLVANPEKSLKPKLDFLLSEGFSRNEVADILVANPTLLARNLERGLIATYRFLSSALPSRSDVVSALKCGNQCLTFGNEFNISILRDCGMSESLILYLLKRFPMALMRSTDHLEESVKKLKEMGLDPQTKMFAYVLGHLSYMSKATWVRKLKLFQELGWSECEAVVLFKKHPSLFCLSDERLRSRVDCFEKVIGWDRAFISMNPALLQFSLEKRILPRVSVLKALMSKGIVEKKWSQSMFYKSDKLFFEQYVKKYVADVPEITKTYDNTIPLVS